MTHPTPPVGGCEVDRPKMLRPTVVLISDVTRDALAPTLNRLIELIRESMADPDVANPMMENGWTAEMLAWGRLLNELVGIVCEGLRDPEAVA